MQNSIGLNYEFPGSFGHLPSKKANYNLSAFD
jgi:hypothetical protein